MAACWSGFLLLLPMLAVPPCGAAQSQEAPPPPVPDQSPYTLQVNPRLVLTDVTVTVVEPGRPGPFFQVPAPTRIDQDCNVHHGFPTMLQRPMEDLVDAFLYFVPQDLRVKEKIPADIALDAAFHRDLQQGGPMIGFPDAPSETSEEFDRQIVGSAADPLFAITQPKDAGAPDPQLANAVQACLDNKHHSKP